MHIPTYLTVVCEQIIKKNSFQTHILTVDWFSYLGVSYNISIYSMMVYINSKYDDLLTIYTVRVNIYTNISI